MHSLTEQMGLQPVHGNRAAGERYRDADAGGAGGLGDGEARGLLPAIPDGGDGDEGGDGARADEWDDRMSGDSDDEDNGAGVV